MLTVTQVSKLSLDTDQLGDEEPTYGMDDESDGNSSTGSNYEPMMLRIEREETRGDNFINCRSCGNTFDYTRLTLWVPGYQRIMRRSLQTPNENTHPQIVRCPSCDIENCLGCEKSPHDDCCSFAHTRDMWHTLCAVDDAIINHRKTSPYLTDNKSLNSAVLKALSTLIEKIPGYPKASFGFTELLRKSLLLDQVAVTIRNMTPENRFDSVCLQSWTFLYMLSQRDDLRGLLFEDRLQFLRNMSPGLRLLGFPVSYFAVQRVYDADRYAPSTYCIWSIIKDSHQSAHEFLSSEAELNDAWPAVQLARNIVRLYDDLKTKQSPPTQLIAFIQGQQLQSFAARLEDIHRIEGRQYGVVHENTRKAPSPWIVKKRGHDLVKDQDGTEASWLANKRGRDQAEAHEGTMGGKRRRG